jgi:hypothetical protein
MREDILKMAREAGLGFLFEDHLLVYGELERFAALVADAEAKRMHDEGMVTVGYMRQQIAAERNKLAQWMIDRGYATGHGDTTEDLLQELEWQIAENWTRGMANGVQAEREACAKVCDRMVMYGPVAEVQQRYNKASADCRDAIRARGQA